MNDIKNCTVINELDASGNPSGGFAEGVGFTIRWQQGPLGRHTPDCVPGDICAAGCTRLDPTGAFVETIISIAKQRIEFYQESAGGKFRCVENEIAASFLGDALNWLEKRTKVREARRVEGTHAV